MNNKRWSDKESATAVAMRADGYKTSAIAAKLGKGTQNVIAHLRRIAVNAKLARLAELEKKAGNK